MISLNGIREYVRDAELDRRWIVALLLLLVAVLGLGFGTVTEGTDSDLPGVLPDDADVDPEVELETPAPEESGTPTPGESGTPTPGESGTPAPGESGTPTSDGDGTDTPGVLSDSSTETPTPTATATPTDDEDSESTSEDSTGGVDLEVAGDTATIQVADALPGAERTVSVVVRNNGTGPGEVGAVIDNVTDRENSFTEPERAVDDTAGEGELSSELHLRLAVDRSSSADPAYLFGGPNEYVPLAALEGETRTLSERLSPGETATLRLDLRIPATAGNEIQSDGVRFNCTVLLRDASSG